MLVQVLPTGQHPRTPLTVAQLYLHTTKVRTPSTKQRVFIVLQRIPGFTAPSTIAASLTGFATRVPSTTVGTGRTAPGGITEVTRLAASYQPHGGVRGGLESRGGSSSPSVWQHEPLVGQHLWEMVSILSTPASKLSISNTLIVGGQQAMFHDENARRNERTGEQSEREKRKEKLKY